MRPYLDLALLGAAFLLLETRGVTRFALLFGTTWLVNALVFAGVLVVVLLAVEITRTVATASLPRDQLRPARRVPRADGVRARAPHCSSCRCRPASSRPSR